MIRLALIAAAALALGAAPLPAASGDDPEKCHDAWAGVGLPVVHKDERAGDADYACHLGYLVRHNNLQRTPDYVIERLTAERVKELNKRPSADFRSDEVVPEAARAVDADYRNSGLARGHQAASSDFAFDGDWMTDTFFFSNAVPQIGGAFNSSIWAQLEQRVQEIAERRSEIYVITGPIYQDFFADASGRPTPLDVTAEENPCGNAIALRPLEKGRVCRANNEDATADCGTAGVAVPAGLFKIVFDPTMGRINAWILPNVKHPSASERGTTTEEYLKTFQVSVLNVEERTGYDFFPGHDRRARRVFEEQCAAMIRR